MLTITPVVYSIMGDRDDSLAVCIANLAICFLVPVDIEDAQALVQAGGHDQTRVCDANRRYSIPMAISGSL